MSKSKWSAEKTWKFVVEYRIRECLWNTKLPSYKDRQLKDAAYSQLGELFGCGVNDVKIKIKNLRTTYIQEHKKIQESIRANNNGNAEVIYVPSLVWYKEMDSFLRYTSVGKMTPLNTSTSEIKLRDSNEIHIKEEALDINSESMELPNFDSTHELKQVKEVGLQFPKKRKQMESHNIQITMDNLNSDLSEEHEFDIFGKSVAKQLKSFSSIAAALRVQSKIQSLLTEERIQDQIAAADANSRLHSSVNQRFFYNQGSSHGNWCNASTATEVISVMLPSTSTQDISNLSNESCTSASLLEDNKEFEVTFMN